MPTNTIFGFMPGDGIDLANIAFSSSGSASIQSGNQLQISENGSSYVLQLDPSANYSGATLALSQDTASGTLVVFGSQGFTSIVSSSLYISSGTASSGLLVKWRQHGLCLLGAAVSNVTVGNRGVLSVYVGASASGGHGLQRRHPCN